VSRDWEGGVDVNPNCSLGTLRRAVSISLMAW
jgi:hypothetical protein